MDESILNTIKKLLGIQDDYTQFDQDIIIHINSVFMILNQLGVGPSEGFYIEDEDAVWSDFLNNAYNLEAVKTYIYMRVKLMFDQPQSSSVKDSMEKIVSELEWRLNISVDPSSD